MDKTYIGTSLAAMAPGLENKPVTGVRLLDTNGDITGEAGNETGFVIEALHPNGTNAMAAAILAEVSGMVYRPYDGQDAMLDPSAELGDGVSVGGMYSLIASADASLDTLYPVSIAAGGSDEIDDEYPFKSPLERQIERNYAETRSLITKSNEEILLKVENEISGLSSSVDVKLDSITSQVTGLAESVNGLSESVSTISQKVDNITLSVSNSETSSVISLNVNGITVSSDTVSFTGDVVFASNLQDGTTVISGDNIQTGTITAAHIKLGGDMDVYEYVDSNTIGGTIGYTTGAFGGAGIHMAADGDYVNKEWRNGEVLVTSDGASVMFGGSKSGIISQITCYDSAVTLEADGGNLTWTGYGLVSNNEANLGTSRQPWDTVYANTTEIQTSDRNKKNTIAYDVGMYDALFDALKPATFKLNSGTSGRRHLGMIAQDVEESLVDCGIASVDFAGFIKSPRDDGGYDYALRYGEFVALLIWQVQNLKKRMEALEHGKGN